VPDDGAILAAAAMAVIFKTLGQSAQAPALAALSVYAMPEGCILPLAATHAADRIPATL